MRRKIEPPTSAKMNRIGSRLNRPGTCVRRPAALRLGQRLAFDHAQHAVHARRDASVVVAGAQLRDDHFVDDPVGRRVGQRTLESAADLDAQLAVVARDDEDRPVIDALAPEPPRVGDPDRVLLDGFGLGRRHDQHRDLAALGLLERPQLRLERGRLVGLQRSGQVGDRRTERRDRDQPLLRAGRWAQPAARPRLQPLPRCDAAMYREIRASGHPRRVSRGAAVAQFVAGAGFAKSTVGGFAIAASFSTVKFGFTL